MILILLMFALITMPLTLPLFKSSTQYSMFNTGWDGVSKFIKLAYSGGRNVVPVLAPFDAFNLDGADGALLIIGPNTTFTGPEIEEIRGFLRRGNTLVIADDFGTGNEILKGLGVPARLSSHPLRDFFYEKDDRLIVSVRVDDPLLSRNVTRILTNEPSAIIKTGEGYVYSSRVAVIDGKRDMFPLVAEVEYGGGRIVLLADPDVLTNQLYDVNLPFLENLLEYIGADTLYIDEAHHPDFNLYTVGTVTVTRFLPRDVFIKIIITLAAVVLALELGASALVWRLVSMLLARFAPGKETPEELAKAVARKNGWDPKEVVEMLERMGG
nr:DUF4350 domain-containing protein [Thermococcus sp. M36]